MFHSKVLIDIWGNFFIFIHIIFMNINLHIYFQYLYHNNTQKKLQNLSTFHFTDEENRAHRVQAIKKKINGNYHHLVDEKIEVETNSRITIEENNKNH